MASLVDGENDDDFDWEAAVREIDVACENAEKNDPSRLAHRDDTSNDLSSVTKKKQPSAFRNQTTLDRFLGNRTFENQNQQQQDYAVVEGEQSASYIEIDVEAAKTWIYPVNIPLRDYQLAITKTALFSNTLVALPTGLGKTLIAAVVMYNYFRWFPDGKIVFTAPSRPLVMQQIEACHNIVGIPQEWTIDMTGQINPTTRAGFWKCKRVFFVTPQVLEKDIQAGTCLVRHLVCLVIDEAHRASGNYSYCVAVRELMAVPVQLRILALTATPGSKQQAIQHIIDNLHISTLEYRDENDPDVSPYVHNRKIELIEVPLGKDAVDINARLLAVIRPYVGKLSALGLLPNRDYLTLSPPDLLNSRDKFRQAPPENLPHNRYGEMEAYFGGLITLYHIRKLLSSHGIRPAYEMLEEKLKQGSFARLMSKNEDIRQVKLLMEKSLSHGAPSPKLSKMLEILVGHFKTKDPQNSRVIIFSNFRGSVRDIMNALTSIGDLVKATEFIGQSSGKASKGQSQKVQQAVLQKFRAGGYNVIVATSIGEEGLDIMEVDLVMCFDANISPLRMIQRMGRTGRKHDGRVVVLACEGSELKGYMRKQASGRSIRKHMNNGGVNSFNFHSSPRMIPHVFKPEVQFVKMSIEQYVSHRRKVNGSNATRTPVSKNKLTAVDTALIEKYFQVTGKNIWRPSMIAFPRFQAFPSEVHTVMHSSRTDMLIDMMQQLHGLTFSSNTGTCHAENELPFYISIGNYAVEQDQEDKLICDYPPSIKPLDVEKTNSCDILEEILMYDKASPDTAPQKLCGTLATLPICKQSNCSTQQEMLRAEVIPDTLNLEKYLSSKEDIVYEPVYSMESSSSSLADIGDNNFPVGELSPRLTSMIKSGIVPESPIDGSGPISPKKAGTEDCNSCKENVSVSPNINEIRTPLHEISNILRTVGCTSRSPVAEETNTPLVNITTSCSKDWLLSSGEMSENVNSVPKLKRLRKIGDIGKIGKLKGENENHDGSLVSPIQIKQVKGKNNLNKQVRNVRVFIEEEAEVSSEGEVSEDEKDDQENSSYEHSFIDDQTNPTAASTQGESIGVDMMAFYRRSLLTQSPMVMESSSSATFTPDSGTTINRINESRSSPVKTLHSVQRPQTDPKSYSIWMDSSSLLINSNGIPIIVPNATAATDFSTKNESQFENRKRKLSFGQSALIPAVNLEQKFCLRSDAAEKELLQHCATEQVDTDKDALDDDEFFSGLDLDAVEQQALKNHSESSAAKLNVIPEQNLQSFDMGTPSFDLGI